MFFEVANKLICFYMVLFFFLNAFFSIKLDDIGESLYNL